jgi:hypothetical protein
VGVLAFFLCRNGTVWPKVAFLGEKTPFPGMKSRLWAIQFHRHAPSRGSSEATASRRAQSICTATTTFGKVLVPLLPSSFKALSEVDKGTPRRAAFEAWVTALSWASRQGVRLTQIRLRIQFAENDRAPHSGIGVAQCATARAGPRSSRIVVERETGSLGASVCGRASALLSCCDSPSVTVCIFRMNQSEGR